MKTILVLTNFSAKAENAAVHALKIAENAHANIILYYSFESFQPVNMPESGAWIYEDYEVIKAESLAELKKLKEYVVIHHQPEAFEPEISLLNEMGYDFGRNVNRLVKDKNIDLIIMGTKGDELISHLFNGSDAYDILEHATCPILFVPETGSFDCFKTIIFADDLKKDYTEAINFLIGFAQIYDSHVIITHFGEYDNNARRCLNLIKNTLGYTNVTSRLLPFENISEQLREFATSIKADAVALIHHGDNRLENFIYGSDSKKMLMHNHVPVLILRD